MTHIGNLDAIFGAGALLAISRLDAKRAAFTNIAYDSIQARRAAKRVPCGPGGCLHDYVPFYFTKRSPMLYTINRGNVPCDGGQDALVHLISTVQKVSEAGLGFAFSDGHGIMAYSNFYDDLTRLDQLDWEVIASKNWADTTEDGDRKRRKQAEFLVLDRLPLQLLSAVVVRTPERRNEVETLLKRHELDLKVAVNPAWYY
jgi:hypothetical protein